MRKTFVATAAILMLAGGVPTASAATTPRTAAGIAAGAGAPLVLPAAALSNTRLTVQWDGRQFNLTVTWNIGYTAAEVARGATFQTCMGVWEDDDFADDLLANGCAKEVTVRARTQDHSVTQRVSMNRAAINTEIGDEEVYARAYVSTPALVQGLNSNIVEVDD
ncbi:hypothetical protein [Streptomyces sp. NPDC090798]|uniref:hypothetical protein n=1 Tax=Streptomyces sp. NPDC090798 TaxID=3365968 RepID=UPI00382446BF